MLTPHGVTNLHSLPKGQGKLHILEAETNGKYQRFGSICSQAMPPLLSQDISVLGLFLTRLNKREKSGSQKCFIIHVHFWGKISA